MDLEVTPFQDEKYGEMYNYKTPFELNEVIKLVYEKAKVSTRGVFRRWDPEKKMWCGNKLWIEILSKEMETMPEPQKKGKFDRSNMPVDAIRGIPAPAPGVYERTQVGAPVPAYTPEQAVDQLKIAVLNLHRVLDKIDSSVQDQVKESMKKLNMQTNLISATISSAS